MWTIFQVFIEFFTILLLFYALVFRLQGTWDLSSLTRGGTHTACNGRWSLNHWITREVFLFSHSLSSPLSLWLYLSLSLKNTECAYMLSYFSHVRLFATPWTVARQAPLSIGFSRQEYWSGVPCPPPGNLPDPGIKPASFYVSCIGREVLYHLVPPGKCPLLPTKKNHTQTEKHTNAAANLYILNTYLLCTFRGTTYSFIWWFIIIYKLFIY